MSRDPSATWGSAATRMLLRSFTPRSGRWRTPTGEAWQPAVAVEAVLLAYERTRSVSLLNVVEKSFARYRGRRSRFFDDDGWYLNAWLRAYDVTGDPKYLAEGRSLFETMTHGWDDQCGGGLWWNSDRTYKNAITNELFLLAAARLAVRTGQPRYLTWAVRCWQWFDASGMINAEDLVNDGLNGDCLNNGQTTWTYNQGVILGGLVELHRITEDDVYLDRARRIAAAAMRSLVHSGHGVLDEQPAGFENRDAHVFKGVLAQGLARLCAADPVSQPVLRPFLLANAEAVSAPGVPDFGVNWLGGSGPVNAASRASAALLLNSVDLLEQGRAPGAACGFGETRGAPPADGIRLEAEAATLVGVGVESTHDGYTGTGYVAGWHRDGEYIEFTLGPAGAGQVQLNRDAEAARDRIQAWRTVTLRYAAGAGDAYRSIAVDGVVVVEGLLFTSTSSWDTYSTVSLDLRLRADSSVQLRLDASGGDRNYLNVDSLTIR